MKGLGELVGESWGTGLLPDFVNEVGEGGQS